MQIAKILAAKKKTTQQFLASYFQKQKEIYQKISPWGEDFIRKLSFFCRRGKNIRASLFLLSTEKMSEYPMNLLPIAASLELIQAGLLIHDDLMDHDLIRRSNPSFWAQYLAEAKNEKVYNDQKFAYAMGICAGDITFFMAWQLMQTVNLKPEIINKLNFRLSQEISWVGIGQMDDVFWSHKEDINLSKEQIINLYRYKTARYSFSLPLVLATIVTEQNALFQKKLVAIGENLGIIYQILDDQIGLLNSSDKIGKPAGSDIRENKKTLIRQILFLKANKPQQKTLHKIWQKEKVETEDLETVKEIYQKSKSAQVLKDIIQNYQNQAQKLIADLGNSAMEKFLTRLNEFLLTRQK